jgi:hypothetical protein
MAMPFISLNHLPVSAFVRTNTADQALGLHLLKVIFDSAVSHRELNRQFLPGYLGVVPNDVHDFLGSFLDSLPLRFVFESLGTEDVLLQSQFGRAAKDSPEKGIGGKGRLAEAVGNPGFRRSTRRWEF